MCTPIVSPPVPSRSAWWGWSLPQGSPLLPVAPEQPCLPQLGQVSCSCREGYSGDGIQTCVPLDPCSQVRTPDLGGQAGYFLVSPPAGWCPRSCLMSPSFLPLPQNNGGCSPYAICNSTGAGQRTCTCDVLHTVGDGFTCRTHVGLVMTPSPGPLGGTSDLGSDPRYVILMPVLALTGPGKMVQVPAPPTPSCLTLGLAQPCLCQTLGCRCWARR